MQKVLIKTKQIKKFSPATSMSGWLPTMPDLGPSLDLWAVYCQEKRFGRYVRLGIIEGVLYRCGMTFGGFHGPGYCISVEE